MPPLMVLYRPLWHYLLALLGIILGVFLLVDGILALILWLASVPFSFWIIVGWSLVPYAVVSGSLCRYLWKRFVRVTPSASFALQGDFGPWLSWIDGPQTTMVVNWFTGDVTPSQVGYGLDQDHLQLVEGAPGKIHHLSLQGLAPGTTYQYRVLHFPHDARLHAFSTAPRQPRPFSFTVVGDTQNEGGARTEGWSLPPLMAAMKDVNPDLLLHTGDLTDQGNDVHSWRVTLDALSTIAADKPLQVAIGNHDTGTHYMHDKSMKKYPDEGANFDYLLGYRYKRPATENQITSFAGRYYSFDYANCHFLFVDTENQKFANPKNPQWEFIRRDLAAVPPGMWKIALVHWPQQSLKKALKQSGLDLYDYYYPPFAKVLCPLFDAGGVDLVLQGHDHVFLALEWTYGPNAPFYDPAYAGPRQPVWYITSGAAGEQLRRNSPLPAASVPLPGFHFYEDSSHYLLVKIDGDTCVVEPRYPDNTLLGGQRFEIRRRGT